jgi:phosphoribosylaminoimidazole-succinocarboxamide synthase
LGSDPNCSSYDKQFVRDWLEAVRINGKPWDKTPPAPRLPEEIIAKTAAKYQAALTRLMALGWLDLDAVAGRESRLPVVFKPSS